MSNIIINTKDGRLSVHGYQPEITRIYWSELPTKFPSYGQPLDLDGCEITAIYADGSEAVITDYCTFSPDTGATVPNAKTLTVTATYTARSGKVCQADETLPICIPSYIKIIVPREVSIVKERELRFYNGNIPSWWEIASMFGFGDVYACLYWERDNEVVAVSRVSATFSRLTGFYEGGSGSYASVGVIHSLSSQNYTRYLTPTETEEVDADYTVKIGASYRIYGITLTTSAYLEADKVQGMRLRAVPTDYSGTQTEMLTTASNVRILYSSGDIEMCDYTAAGAGFYSSNLPHIVTTKNIKLRDEQNGSFPIAIYLFEGVAQTTVNYACSGGAVTWTPEGIII